MDSLIKLQLELQQSIEKAQVKYYNKVTCTKVSVEYVECLIENLERDWLLFRSNHLKLAEMSATKELSDTVYVKNDVYDKVQDIYVDYNAALKSARNKHNRKPQQNNDSNSHTDHSASLVRLPKISIPIFSGKYSEWTTFRDLFISLVDKNSSLDNVQKLHYLKGHLTGEAEQLIRQIPITDANYNQCWDQLENRYNNKKYLVNCILKRLFSQKRMITENASGLKELLDTTSDCMNALKNIGIDVSTWDIIIIHIVTHKLDPETRKQWELQVSSDKITELPDLKQLETFIQSRFRALEFVEPKRQVVQNNTPHNKPKTFLAVEDTKPNTSNAKVFVATQDRKVCCEYCSENHKLCFCKGFAKLDSSQKRQFVMQNNICYNCLGGNHMVNQCQKPTNCRICKKRHHTLLHISRSNDQSGQEAKATTSSERNTSEETTPLVSCLSTQGVLQTKQVLLATALVKVQARSGDCQIVRALIDQGSQASFVTEATVQLLRLKKVPIKGIVSGLGTDNTVVSKYMTTLILQSMTESEFKIELKAYVLKNITSYLPERKIDVLQWTDLKEINLADPQFDRPNRINVLLGADIYGQILKEGFKRAPTGSLIAQCTSLGWILSGAVEPVNRDEAVSTPKITVMHVQVNENDILKQFWELEDQGISSTNKMLTEEEAKCEEHFAATTKRSPDGRYIVRLPFREEYPKCIGGNSKDIAIKRLKAIERRFNKAAKLKTEYKAVINEYLELGHMREVKQDNREKEGVHLPHHAVIREDKTTTKVRVVFDASCKNENGVSLNDTLMIGPTLQSDLRHIVMRWRIYPIGLVADIIKMYRQVRVADDDAAFQRIVWRDSPADIIKDYELTTVTFGTASAPYLAVKALHQVAIDEGQRFPQAAERLPESFYMADLMTGCFSIEEGQILYKEMTDLLKSGGFVLQKWNTNSEDLLKAIDKSEKNKNNTEQDKQNKEQEKQDKTKGKEKGKKENKDIFDTTKILGLTWSRCDDIFKYTVQLPPEPGTVTKRTIISDIARLFDPLGWIAPSVVIAKMFIQKLWLAGLDWDEQVPTSLMEEWNTYRRELTQLTRVHIPRWLGVEKHSANVELHGFSDASKAAYAAVVYTRSVDQTGRVRVSLLVAKTKVAPIKQISIPRLELCGAVLLSRLLVEVADAMHISKDNLRAWTDSSVVLAWLNSHPSRWKTFVANRVSEILTTLDTTHWAHVSSKNNPADCASRGIQPSLLAENNLWLCGPEFLREQNIIYNKPKDIQTNLEQSIKSHVCQVDAANTANDTPWQKFSSLRKLVRVVAYCRRFINFRKDKDRPSYLQKREIDQALKCCIRISQKEAFSEEYVQLKKKGSLSMKTSQIKSLCPYIDQDDIIRVSGRLKESSLPDQTKHPIILPHDAHLSKLIVADAHERTLHGGPQLMQNYIRSAYWIVKVKSLVKQHVRKCIICIRNNAQIKTQFMGSLPSVRCNPTRAFLHSGVDYAGPINIRTTKGRGHHAYKGYICVFVCMATKAIHLEVVSDMSSSGFLAAFRRFVSRRGHCAQLWSDNGTNFVGAARELRELADIQSSLAENLAINGTEWHFIPPHAPNFGGLWEAAVKSTKSHLKRVIGDTTLTYEEMSTLLSQVEACLNSRPLTTIQDNDSVDPTPLTPGHFLVGEPLVTVPDINLENVTISPLNRWQLVQKMLQNFWRRWSQEYLTTLVHRYKWSRQVPEPKIGDVVLVKEDDLPPSRWLMGRVLEKHPGNDNITRVVTLKTKGSTLKRPTSKLCVLPVNEIE